MSRHPIVKMSKSLGNVINPDEVVDQYGADTMRLYEMFMGDFEQAAPWQTSAIAGCNRFLDRVWALSDKLVEGEGYRPQIETLMQQTIKKVGADIETLKMNTAIAQLMTLVNALYDNGGATKAELRHGPAAEPLRSPHDRGAVGEAGSRPQRAAGLLSVACLRGGQVCGGCCGDRRAGERQGEGPPEGGPPTSPPRTPSPPPRPTPQWLPRWKASSWSRRSTSRAVWSTWPSRAENCCSAEKREHIITRGGGPARRTPGNGCSKIFQSFEQKLSKKVDEPDKMRYTVYC